MEKGSLAKSILSLIESHEGMYPIYTKEIEEVLKISNAKATYELSKLRKEGKIFSREVTWVKGFKTFHIPSDKQWPTFLSTKCRDCHYKSTIKTCIFHTNLYDDGANCELARVGTKLNKNAVGCPSYVSRVTGWKTIPLERFVEITVQKQNDYFNQKNTHLALDFSEDDFFEENDSEQFLPKYHCIFCLEEMTQLGSGFLPLIGSSVTRCSNCESLYKLVFDDKEEKFVVLCAEEFGDIYRHNFEQIAKTPSTMVVYSSSYYGISIPKNVDYFLDTVSETLIIANWIGKLSALDYIVVRSFEDFEALRKALEKDYSHITIINGEDLLISPKPTAEEIGILKLLRKTKLLNVAFCLATLESRKSVLALLAGTVNEELRLNALQKIDDQIKKLKRFQLLKVKDWNEIDMNAANAMFHPIKDFLEKEGIEFPGRGLGRHVTDRFKPYGLYYAYSEIDAIINGLMRITSNEVKQYCTMINFCWDGLSGICHGKTRGGVYGFHLDLIEPFKLAALTILCNAILEGKFDFDNVSHIIGRRRQKIFFVTPKSELNVQLKEQVAIALNQKGRKHTVKQELENYFLHVKFWIQSLIENTFAIRVAHHGQEFAAWTLVQYQIWHFLKDEQVFRVILELEQIIAKLQIDPYTFQQMN